MIEVPYIDERTVVLGEKVSLANRFSPVLPELYLAFEQAITASAKSQEVHFILQQMDTSGYIEHEHPDVTILPKGYELLLSQQNSARRDECFVAMSFDGKWDNAYSSAIKPAIEECGYKSIRIDQVEHNEKIDDQIVAAIKQARFVVADISQTNDINNANVYYECGLAHGRNLPVVFLCYRSSATQSIKLPFDTQQYACIFWEDHQSLKENLKNRILATMEQGPVPVKS